MLSGKTALITGAGRGIGRAIALAMAREGARVIVNYRGSREKAEAVREEILAMGAQADIYGCDVSDPEEVREMFQTVTGRYAGLDILVNNAGITRDNLILRMKEEELDEVLNVNLKGAFYCMKCAARLMLRQRSGRIINLSSVVGVHGNAGQVNYSAAKAGLIGMTKSLAKELGSRGITVNAIAPGFIETDMTEKLPEELRKSIAGTIPMGRFGAVEEVASTAVFLASGASSYITGQVIGVDGGMGI